MTKDEIKKLLAQIKIMYPRFDSVEKKDNRFAIMPEVAEVWFQRLGWMEYDRAIKILDRYMESENGSKTPGIALWMGNGKAQARAEGYESAYFDRKIGAVIWKPESDGPTFERKVTFNEHNGCWEDEEGYLWAFAGED